MKSVVEQLVARHREDTTRTHLDRDLRGTDLGLGLRLRHDPRLLLRDDLKLVVHRRVELVPADVPVVEPFLGIRAERLEVRDVFHDVVTEPLRVLVCCNTTAERLSRVDEVLVDGNRNRLVVLLVGDVTFVEHRLEDDIAAGLVRRVVRRVGQVALHRVLNNGNERSGFRDGDIRRGLAEVQLSCRFHAIGVSTEARNVEVREKDLFLRVTLFESKRELDFLELTLERGRGRFLVGGLAFFFRRKCFGALDVHVLDDLHRQGRRTRLDATRNGVAHSGADKPGHVDAAVLVEAAVLTSDSGVLEELRNLVPADFLTVLPVHRRDLGVAVRGVRVILRVNFVGLCQLVQSDEVRHGVEDADGVLQRDSANRHNRRQERRHHHTGEGGGEAQPDPRTNAGGELRQPLRHRLKVTE